MSVTPWPTRRFADLVGIDHPILQAPMAGVATPELAAAVSNAGALGALGLGTEAPDKLPKHLRRIGELTSRPVHLNFFVHAPPTRVEVPAPMRALLAGYAGALGIAAADAEVPFEPFATGHLARLLEAPPRVVSFHFGLPERAVVAELQAHAVVVLGCATTVGEARALERIGVDAIIAQGSEAGGHRGTFAAPFEAGMIGTLALVPQIVDAVGVPVIAAGGIADGRAIAAAFALGASAVQIGTAFSVARESGLPAAYRAAIRRARADETRVTRLFSGRPARALRNRMLDSSAGAEADAADFPVQLAVTRALASASRNRGSIDYAPVWLGQAAPLTRERSASELVQLFANETLAAIQRLSSPPSTSASGDDR